MNTLRLLCLSVVFFVASVRAGDVFFASSRSPSEAGRLMANGQRYEPSGFACMTDAFPVGTQLLVRCGGRAVILRVTDRAPSWVSGRSLGLSPFVFAMLTDGSSSVVSVSVEAGTR